MRHETIEEIEREERRLHRREWVEAVLCVAGGMFLGLWAYSLSSYAVSVALEAWRQGLL